MTKSVRELLRSALDLPTDAHPGMDSREEAEAEQMDLTEWQETMFAGQERSVLLVLQGMDTSGKGGTIKHVFAGMNPQFCDVSSFKRPTDDELVAGFLWRIRQRVPTKGVVGIFDRSHYEDVLVVRVHGPEPAGGWERRYQRIVAFEQELAESGTAIVKCFLNISYEEQRERLAARLDEPSKNWKFREGDLSEREHWPAYMEAYHAAIEATDHDAGPWYVIPADRKWYRNWAVSRLMAETFADMALPSPPELPHPERDRLRGLLMAT